MPIASSDLLYRLSGGAANAVPASSLGGAMSSVAAGANVLGDVSSAETVTGRVKYRCIYVKNNHATLTLVAPTVFLPVNTPSADTDVAIGVGTSAVNGTEQAVANETTAPVGVAFSSPSTKGAGVALGDLQPGWFRAIWIRQTTNAGAAAPVGDSCTWRVEGDTAA